MAAAFVHTSGQGACSRLVKRLLDAGATSEWSAQPLEPRNRIEERTLARTLRRGLIKRTAQGTFWVDEARYSQWRTTQLRYALIAVFAMFLMFAILFVLGEFP